jgi:hypothetical protein
MLCPILALLALPLPGETPAMCRPADHAPAGVMDLRCPMDQAWMLSLTTSYTRFQGMQDNAQHISLADVLAQGYAQAPESMDMTMLMLDVMYSPAETFTIHASVPWISNSMDMRTNLGEKFTMDSSGLGDTQIGADLVVWEIGEQSVSTGISVGLPSGSITEKGGMPGTPPMKLEYAMQLGSGTYDLSGRLDYRAREDPYSYGVGLAGTTRTGHNSEDYALGDRFEGTAWGAQEWSSSWSGSVRITAARWSNVRGADPDLDPLMSPTNDPHKQGGQRVDGALGLNWTPFHGDLAGSVIGFELGMPLAQDLDGPQISEDWFAALRVGLSF